MRKFIKLLIGIGLIPLCGAVSIAVYRLYQNSIETALTTGREAWALPAGFLLWVAVFFLLPRPVRTYVLGHELTHALWTLMMGGRIGKIKVGKDGGHVEVSKSNFITTLAPYFFPFYSFLVISAYYLAGLSTNVEVHRFWWMVAVGLTWSFHVTFTIHMLAQRQPDIQEHGHIFSYTVIYIMNMLVIGLWMIMVGTPYLKDLGILIVDETRDAYCYVNQVIQSGLSYIANYMESKSE